MTNQNAEVISDGATADMVESDEVQSQIDLASLEKQVAREAAKVNSRITLSAYSSAALIAQEYSVMPSTDINELQAQLLSQCLKVKDGDLGRAETMLIAQAHSLDAIFTRLALDASINLRGNMRIGETQLRLALKAQSQCRNTLEALALIKNPSVIFAKQANIAHGHQQVNNGGSSSPARVENIEAKPNELLEHDHGKWLDPGAASPASGSNKAVATVEVIHGATDG